jgi:hypothetical protein
VTTHRSSLKVWLIFVVLSLRVVFPMALSVPVLPTELVPFVGKPPLYSTKLLIFPGGTRPDYIVSSRTNAQTFTEHAEYNNDNEGPPYKYMVLRLRHST